MVAAFLEEWDADGDTLGLVEFVEPYGKVVERLAGSMYEKDPDSQYQSCERAKIAGAAPEMVQALLVTEVHLAWGVGAFRNVGASVIPSHLADAVKRVDAALTKAGFPDAASRDEARELMAAAASPEEPYSLGVRPFGCVTSIDEPKGEPPIPRRDLTVEEQATVDRQGPCRCPLWPEHSCPICEEYDTREQS